MGWILFVATLVGAAVGYVLLQSKAAAERERMEARQREVLDSAKVESNKRFDRLEREADRARLSARDGLAKDLLPAVDSVRLAHDNLNDAEVQKGLELVLSEFDRAFARHDITRIEPVAGDAFDPNEHEAVESVDAEPEDARNGTVARCHRVGYRSDEKVLRPAMVGVYRVELQPSDDPGESEEEIVFAHGDPDEDEAVEPIPATASVER